MEHLFNCHGEWTSFFYFLPGFSIAALYARNHIKNFWLFIRR